MKEELLDKKENGWKEIDEGRKNEIFGDRRRKKK